MGRPSTYTPEIGAAICSRLARGETLRRICLDPGLPDRHTVADWRRAFPDFDAQYAQARRIQAEVYFDEVIDISDETVGEPSEVQSAKLRADSRKWVLARMDRGLYGDHASLNVGGQAGNPLEVKHAVDLSKLSDEQRETLAKIGRELATGGEG